MANDERVHFHEIVHLLEDDQTACGMMEGDIVVAEVLSADDINRKFITCKECQGMVEAKLQRQAERLARRLAYPCIHVFPEPNKGVQ